MEEADSLFDPAILTRNPVHANPYHKSRSELRRSTRVYRIGEPAIRCWYEGVANASFKVCRFRHAIRKSNMKKIALAIATLVVSVAAVSQPGPPQRPVAPHMDRQQMQPHGRPHGAKKRKVWVPAHREHGRMVRGHYAWR